MVSLSLGRAVEVAHGHAGQQGDGHHGQGGQFVAAEAGDGRVEGADVPPGQVADRRPDPDPERGADRVQGQEPAKAHPGQAGQDAVGLAQAVDEAGHRDDLAAVPVEELLHPGHPVRRQQHEPAEPGQQPPPAVAADEPADAVTQHRGRERDHRHQHDVQPARAREDRGGDQHRLARDRDPEVLQQEQASHGRVPVLAQIRGDGGQQAGQRRGRHPAAREPGEGMSLAGALPFRRCGMAQSSERAFYR
jgi:hypothetical protein